MYRAQLTVEGIVQGVGFRPAVYRLAHELGLTGYVRNMGNLVEIVLEGDEERIKRFIKRLKAEKPPISRITRINNEISAIDSPSFSDFSIKESSSESSGTSVIPADVATCSRCLEEIMDENNRRYLYPFTACTDCGPRFTVIESIPYDRERTSMREFPLCSSCMEEYLNPLDRRYHAEATCCPVCGPRPFLWRGDVIETDNPLKMAAELLDEGEILAVKGIGGTHLVCRADDEDAVMKLRSRLGRPSQPFACMSPDVPSVKVYACISEAEEKALTSRRRPIVVLNKNSDYPLAPSVAPGLHNIGVMLPYSGMHHVLFRYTSAPAYVMTSANKPGDPMFIRNSEITRGLKGIADYFLLHDRKIINRCDDSVVRFRGGEMAFIRRSRGYAPEPYDLTHLSENLSALCLGPEIDVTFSVLKGGQCYVSQHIGNTSKYDTLLFLKDAVNYLMGITGTESVDVIACDLHPQFLTTSYAEELSERFSADILRVQHHHAHALALMLDNGVGECVCIAADGVGYGADGTSWGGEILHCHGPEYSRVGSLMPQKMPGGDLATRYPARMLLSMLLDSYDGDIRELFIERYLDYFPHGEREIDVVLKQMETGLNTGVSSSTGRVLDAISAALRICGMRTYEGECAMKLESTAFRAKGELKIPFKILRRDGRYILDTSGILMDVMDLLESGEKRAEIANAAQRAVAEGLAEMAVLAAEDLGVDVIGGTGGVFYNEAISLAVRDYVKERGYSFIQHRNSCAGDGSVSLGQAVAAALEYRK
ncbi:carbamoyltransferase HypF [Methanothermobacter thermautotrophicus]|uniref:carbamoyltransferase HypF n=1 Tax=Methanothermobacter thermautotrophicus TaxID=145262 RepID=UPI003D7FC8A1